MNIIDLILMALRMVWELILVYPWLSLLIVLVALLPWLCVLIRGTPLRSILNGSNLKRSFWGALLAGVLAFFLLPWFFKSNLGELSYLTDWLFHFGSVASVVLYVWFVLLPICGCGGCCNKRCG